MHIKTVAVATGITLFVGTAASAQVVSVGTTEGGAIAQLAAAVSNVVSSETEYQMRPQAMAGTQQYMTGVDLGRIDFGISNIMQYSMAVSGTHLSEGEPHENLRIAATLTPFTQGVIVTNESGVTRVEDLAGMRVPSGYTASPLFQYFWDAFLLGADVDRSEIEEVPLTSLPATWQAFREGQIDTVIAAAGSAPVREMDATIDGGIRYLSLEPDPEMMAALPNTRIEVIEPAEGLVGIVEPTGLHTYDTVLFVHKDVPDEVVHAVVQALAENEAALHEAGPLWRGYETARIAADHGLEYHPGALSYYEEAGLMSE